MTMSNNLSENIKEQQEAILNGLSKEEREKVLSILNDFSKNGKSEQFNALIYDEYKEIPVDIDTFMKDPQYLGKGLINGKGGFSVFPYWVDLLKKIYPNNIDEPICNTLALTGAIGLGKTLIAIIICLYELYRMLCLKNPLAHYNLLESDTISFVLINITLENAKGVAWEKLQSLVQLSPWFMSHGTLSKANNPEWTPLSDYKIELVLGSQPRHFIGRAVKFAFMDEISFQLTQDVEKQKKKAYDLVSEASSRMKSRFMRGEKNPTILVLASSKRTESSFMEEYIELKKKNESKTTIVIDEPQWVVRTDKDSKKKFKIAVGNKLLPSEVLPLDVSKEEETLYIDRGYNIWEIPFGYYEEFLDDLDNALMTIAGISTTSISAYISGDRLSRCKTDSYKNPFVMDIIKVGDGLDDKTEYKDFFDLSRVDVNMKSKPLFIHLDLSLSGDKTGIAGVWIKGKKPPKEGEAPSKELYYQLAFVVSVEAPKGRQVSFEKTRNFIYWLKEQGFAIKGITSDTYARSGVEQDLKQKGYKYEILSVDRVTNDGQGNYVNEPYAYFKNTINEQRIVFPKEGIDLLTKEIVGLKRDNNSGKIDHDKSGIDSKDSSDATCGATYTASKYAEEYAYDYGEDMETMLNFNEHRDEREQLIVNFEEELKNVGLGKVVQNQKKIADDFWGGSQVYTHPDILIW